jgi:type II secretory pathway pseudopilin PulG
MLKRLRAESGTTLVEMLIVLSVLSLVLASTYAILISVQSGFGTQVDRNANAQNAGLAMQQIEKEAQSAEAFTICSSSTCDTSHQVANGTSCPTTTWSVANALSCYLIVYTQTNASTRELTSPGPNAPFSCVEWRVVSLGTSPATYALETRRWQPDYEDNSALVTGWRYITDPMPTVIAGYIIPSNTQLGGRVIQVTVSVNNQSANKTSAHSQTSNTTITRQFVGSNIVSAPNPCVPPNGTVPS